VFSDPGMRIFFIKKIKKFKIFKRTKEEHLKNLGKKPKI
jgi:hypothetical protein